MMSRRSSSSASLLRFGSMMAVALLLLLQQPQPPQQRPASFAMAVPSPWAGRVMTGAALYGLYSVVVDRYAAKKLAAMEALPPAVLPLHGRRRALAELRAAEESSLVVVTSTVVPTVAELRKTISRRSQLVENPKDRWRWIQWAIAPSTKSADKAKKTALPPNGTYRFAYRSYVNFEERTIIANSLYPVQRFFGVTPRQEETMTIEDDGAKVTLSEYVRIPHHFWRLSLVPVTITWRGSVQSAGGRLLGRGKHQIVWTDTEMKLPSRTIERPPESERLRQEPWGIVKFEDGMLLLQRGDIGVLAFDRVADR